ncbi:restriction endonuclease subunit S [Legionella pneumophila serogroup 1]|uniref:restriction endonuclease subunit S n=1 Tax=Legionella pneumophila TaxID=446 RepID=UPI0007708D50|nr:restriction endonuclease subunit S [Legionella pneumophila]MCZ4749683.1 restriction endonuclease subunit S [Legionella pneumophila]CZO93674.1 EcoKI restriction-modification system protein HsdS [Legionella pneumophila]CZP73951.1 EcoKI restriction-modification system protein HsdS [Legionella pneumophila]HAT6348754.1 restriction endonuclease subunit S [Legionella pneumophila]HAT7968991.1 restriction endonuclease subunit S [Legionella pneumophila]
MIFKTVSFLELLDNIVDNRGKTCPVTDDGIALIATNCIKNDSLTPVFEKIRYVTKNTYENWFRAHPLPDDIIFVCKGSPGRVAWTPDPVNFCIAQDMVAIRAKQEIIYPKFLFALLRSKKVQEQIENMHVGTLIPHFKKGDFSKLFLKIPVNYEYQKFVGDLYYMLSKEIELNKKINQTLEAIAQAMFKSWFVDFDPVHAKADAQSEYEYDAIAKELGISREILDLFPSEFEESELGLIPKGWEVKKLAELTSEIRRGISPKYIEEGGILVVNQKCIRDHIVNFSLCRKNDHFLRKVDGRLLEIGDILVNSTGVGTLGRVAEVRYLNEPTVVDSHVTIIRSDNSKYLTFVFAQLILAKESQIETMGEGSTGQIELNRKKLLALEAVVPPMTLQHFANNIFLNISKRIGNNLQTSLNLQKLCDTLLPKLISGELDISNINLEPEND